jgi:hypothetical protein
MLNSTAPTTKEGIEKYLGSGMVKGIEPDAWAEQKVTRREAEQSAGWQKNRRPAQDSSIGIVRLAQARWHKLCCLAPSVKAQKQLARVMVILWQR